eukprot:TRINITY_DN67551_c0_g1_i1.p2 TRINITY_DN67551_c0_g1~~TRINITY_DN67551_c0_g1_i1.p2  ORF type:complete len:145 (-),score=26.53 TRINITY_DN67551_c0_g1_i1:57-491(-)
MQQHSPFKVTQNSGFGDKPRFKELYQSNNWAARSSPELSRCTISHKLDTTHPLFGRHQPFDSQGERSPNHRWFRSHATTFAVNGIQPGHGLQGTYRRDPHTGVWFKDDKNKMWHKEIEKYKESSVPAYRKEMVPMNSVSITIKD